VAVRWIGLLLIEGQHFLLGTASLAVLGYEPNNREHWRLVPVNYFLNVSSKLLGSFPEPGSS
jgi:hypothetical protein